MNLTIALQKEESECVHSSNETPFPQWDTGKNSIIELCLSIIIRDSNDINSRPIRENVDSKSRPNDFLWLPFIYSLH